MAHPDALCSQVLRAIGVADADPDLIGRDQLEQPLDDDRAELTGRTGNDDHEDLHSYATTTRRRWHPNGETLYSIETSRTRFE